MDDDGRRNAVPTALGLKELQVALRGEMGTSAGSWSRGAASRHPCYKIQQPDPQTLARPKSSLRPTMMNINSLLLVPTATVLCFLVPSASAGGGSSPGPNSSYFGHYQHCFDFCLCPHSSSAHHWTLLLIDPGSSANGKKKAKIALTCEVECSEESSDLQIGGNRSSHNPSPAPTTNRSPAWFVRLGETRGCLGDDAREVVDVERLQSSSPTCAMRNGLSNQLSID
ncbi:hypothetical protein BDK51DRAFT_47230 [Blyttiomyces helicus]|uniref:Uncharacterized protein n=1 Tax=Blyttiomyces helicus TaxID=388810 RepID=A0A4P9W5E8_9FUNG|nr:hypothetical protein BDK51DRAFT_47230 [Blyttiomyces helicus]|eukprot:RKO86128.1 hypothetical protein BDK51DRAFT_47230 [Blyttiomyces helicus]